MPDQSGNAHEGAGTEGSGKSCFFVAPIGPERSDIRKRSNQIYKHIVRKAISPLGYIDIRRADHLANPGMITAQMVERLVGDDLVVADLTGANANVYYELAIRHAIRKPFVQMVQIGEVLPFDVADMRTIEFDYRDLDSVEEAVEKIRDQVRALESDPESLSTPLSFAVQLQELRGSGSSTDRRFAEILESLRQLTSKSSPTRTRPVASPSLLAMRRLVEKLARDGRVGVADLEALLVSGISSPQKRWIQEMISLVAGGEGESGHLHADLILSEDD